MLLIKGRIMCKFCQGFIPRKRTLHVSRTLCNDWNLDDRLNQNEVALPLRPIKGKSSLNVVKHFVDWREIRVVGGRGGDGCISFLSVYIIEFAGPDGGDGGHGGHVIFKASSMYRDLSHLKTLIQAPWGVPGKNKDCHGKNANHLIIHVPEGTVFRNKDGVIVGDLNKEGSMFIAAKGGAGGRGNAHFKTSVRQAPEIAESGAEGETFCYNIELRSMADVGLIGFPNAGKSTLLQAVSRARPKVAAYPFTTLNPHIGMVQYDDLTQLAIADIPGILPGASKNHGLGISFLRHIERCSILMYVLDMGEPAPWIQLDQLKYELEQYEPGLSRRPCAILANKMDLEEGEDQLEELRARVGGEVLPISGKTGTNLTNMLIRIKELHQRHLKSY